MAIKFGNNYYPDSMTVKQLSEQLEIENAFIFRVKKKFNNEITAQEILDDC